MISWNLTMWKQGKEGNASNTERQIIYEDSAGRRKILQYNANKSKNKVLKRLFADSKTANFDIIIIQELWCNLFDLTTYNVRHNGFYLVNKRITDIKVSLYINKKIITNN